MMLNPSTSYHIQNQLCLDYKSKCEMSTTKALKEKWNIFVTLASDFPGKNTGVDCHFFLQGIFTTLGSNPHLLHWQADSLPLSY